MGFTLEFGKRKYRRGDKGSVKGFGDGDVSGNVFNCGKEFA